MQHFLDFGALASWLIALLQTALSMRPLLPRVLQIG